MNWVFRTKIVKLKFKTLICQFYVIFCIQTCVFASILVTQLIFKIDGAFSRLLHDHDSWAFGKDVGGEDNLWNGNWWTSTHFWDQEISWRGQLRSRTQFLPSFSRSRWTSSPKILRDTLFFPNFQAEPAV